MLLHYLVKYLLPFSLTVAKEPVFVIPCIGFAYIYYIYYIYYYA